MAADNGSSLAPFSGGDAPLLPGRVDPRGTGRHRGRRCHPSLRARPLLSLATLVIYVYSLYHSADGQTQLLRFALLAILYLVVHALFGRFEERAGQGRKLRLEVQFPSPAPHNDKTRARRGFFVDVAMEGWWSVRWI